MRRRRQKTEDRRRSLAKAGPRREARQAFTLIEIIIVLMIIGILATAVAPRLMTYPDRARMARAQQDISTIGQAIDVYQLETGDYPKALGDLLRRDPPSDYVAAPGRQWNGPYLKRKPQDPWGRDYLYAQESQHDQDYDLSSSGPNGQPGDEDDLGNWE